MRHSVRLGRIIRGGSIALVAAMTLGACQPAATSTPTPTAATPSNGPAPTADGVAPVDSGPPLVVLGTENFYADLLTQIGGPRVQASSFIDDPNADPHAFESNAKDAALVADARLVIVNGLGYDDFMQKLLGASTKPDRIVVNAQQVLALPDTVNVHIWYDPATMPKVATAVTDALSRLDPQNAAFFAARSRAYVAGLKPIGDKIAELKTRFAGRPIAFTEDVAGYLTDQIGLVVKTPIGFMKAVEEGTDPAPSDVAAERDLLTGKTVNVLVYNSQVTSPTTSDIHDLATQNGIPIVGVAETIPPSFHTYQDWQLGQLTDLEHALAKAG